MAISFRANASTNNLGTATTTCVVNVPAGTVAGDVMVATILMKGTPTITPPSGWTAIQNIADGTSESMVTYYRVAGSSEPANYTWSFSGSFLNAGEIESWIGVSNSSPLNTSASQFNASSTSVTAPSLTTTVNGCQLLFRGSDKSAVITAATWTAPPSFTERFAIGNSTSAPGMESSDIAQSTAGVTGTVTATLSSAYPSTGTLIALAPDVGSANPFWPNWLPSFEVPLPAWQLMRRMQDLACRAPSFFAPDWAFFLNDPQKALPVPLLADNYPVPFPYRHTPRFEISPQTFADADEAFYLNDPSKTLPVPLAADSYPVSSPFRPNPIFASRAPSFSDPTEASLGTAAIQPGLIDAGPPQMPLRQRYSREWNPQPTPSQDTIFILVAMEPLRQQPDRPRTIREILDTGRLDTAGLATANPPPVGGGGPGGVIEGQHPYELMWQVAIRQRYPAQGGSDRPPSDYGFEPIEDKLLAWSTQQVGAGIRQSYPRELPSPFDPSSTAPAQVPPMAVFDAGSFPARAPRTRSPLGPTGERPGQPFDFLEDFLDWSITAAGPWPHPRPQIGPAGDLPTLDLILQVSYAAALESQPDARMRAPGRAQPAPGMMQQDPQDRTIEQQSAAWNVPMQAPWRGPVRPVSAPGDRNPTFETEVSLMPIWQQALPDRHLFGTPASSWGATSAAQYGGSSDQSGAGASGPPPYTYIPIAGPYVIITAQVSWAGMVQGDAVSQGGSRPGTPDPQGQVGGQP